MTIREDCKYIKTHQWMREEDGSVLVGITDYAQSQLGGIVFLNLPEAGDTEDAADEPDQLNEDPYGVWLIRVKDVTETTELLTAEEYAAYLETLET